MHIALENNFKSEIDFELNEILKYWKDFSKDDENGGFIGRRDHYNKPFSKASKGVILNTRLLWSFSALGNFGKNEEVLSLAERAFDYLFDFFQDTEHQGVFWELDFQGNPVNKRKQIYAQAFTIYALSEYYGLTGNEQAKDWAMLLFGLIEKNAREKKLNGYFEAFQQDWSPIDDMRLSEKDLNAAKTMNTHLHILEAYTSLLRITNSEKVKEALENLILLFFNKFLDKEIQHFRLFFDVEWKSANNVVSYGHDIEAVWLIIEAAKATGNDQLLEEANLIAVSVANVFLKEAYIKGGGIYNEKDLDTGEIDTDRHWWPQAEAMVGLQYVYVFSGEKKYKEAQLDIWEYIKSNVIDRKNGEWYFRVDSRNKPYHEEDKLSMWKAPYHNSRACMMLLKELE